LGCYFTDPIGTDIIDLLIPQMLALLLIAGQGQAAAMAAVAFSASKAPKPHHLASEVLVIRTL